MTASGFARFLELPPAEREVLRRRAEELARAEVARDSVEQVELLELDSRGQRYAVPLSAVEGVTELASLAAVPRAPPFVCGLTSFRGEVLVGVEVAQVVGAAVGFADLKRVVALSHGGRKLAIIAGKGLDVRGTTLTRFRQDPVGQHPVVVGTDELFVSLLDVEALIRHVFAALGGAK